MTGREKTNITICTPRCQTDRMTPAYFNDPENLMYEGYARYAGLVSFSPDGKKFVGGVQLSLITKERKIVMAEIED